MGKPELLAVILARGGSKGLPGKNVRPFLGMPLIKHNVDALQKSEAITRIILSTDDDEIARLAGCEVPFKRPAHLATDAATSMDTLFHAIDELAKTGYAPQYVMLVQPTSPLRTHVHVDKAFAELVALDPKGSIVGVTKSKPVEWIYRMATDGKLTPVLPPSENSGAGRQALPPAVVPNGALYIAHIDYLRAHKTYFGPDCRGFLMSAEESIDIDTEWEFRFAEMLARNA